MTNRNHRDELPHLGFSGNRVINELVWQIEENKNNSLADVAYFTALLGWVTDEFDTLHDAIKAAEAQGLRNPAYDGDMIGRAPDDYSDYEESA
jgi:hypothetical protein